MKVAKIFFALAAFGMAAGYFTHHQSAQADIPEALSLSRSSIDPCKGKERCLIVYVAPWCGSCKAMLPSLLQAREMFSRKGLHGMKFIVGNSTPARNLAMAQQIGIGAFVDENDVYARKMSVDHFPTIWVLDAENKILSQDQQAVAWINQELGQG